MFFRALLVNGTASNRGLRPGGGLDGPQLKNQDIPTQCVALPSYKNVFITLVSVILIRVYRFCSALFYSKA